MTLPKDPAKREESLRNYREAAQKRSKDPEWIHKNKKANHNIGGDLYKDPEWIRKNKEVGRRNAQNLEWVRKNKEVGIKNSHDLEWRSDHEKMIQNRSQNPNWRFRLIESKVGGFWYGNVRYRAPPRYCELWCPDLWRRIDKAQNYQSILSGKNKEDNGGRALSRHHVYYQKKACCGWDEDAQGYYAMINIGTRKHPKQIKYYIHGDPNKFVLLTAREHGVVAKDKLTWIKVFEDLIEIKLGGVCYIQKDV